MHNNVTTHYVSLLTYVLVCLFGIGSWLAVNGIWVELPNLVNELPEKWKLATYITIICQLANIGPISYSLIRKCFNKKKIEQYTVYVLLLVGLTACVLLACFWSKTIFFLNAERSIALLILTFFVALVDCTSSVTFLPFMSIFPGYYLSALYVGETFSGLIPSVVALTQGVVSYNSSNMTTASIVNRLRYSPDIFFLILAFLMGCCLLSFIALNYLPALKMYHVINSHNNDGDADTCGVVYNNDNIDDREPVVLNSSEYEPLYTSYTLSIFFLIIKNTAKINYLLNLLFLLCWLNAVQNGIVSSISSFAYAPYGSLIYHLAVTLGSISSAIACFLYLYYPNKSGVKIFICSCFYTLLATYIVIVATQSPNPWLQYTTLGDVLMVCISMTSSALVAYTKLSIASVMRDNGNKYLFRAGVANQVGSFLGAVIMFPIVNNTNVFKQ